MKRIDFLRKCEEQDHPAINSDDPSTIRELIKIGRVDIAIEAATKKPDPKMRSLLEELANHPELEIVRKASWQLASYHQYVHPHGEELGFVESYQHPYADCFILYAQPSKEAPSAMAMYPPTSLHDVWDKSAEQMIELVFPKDIRGAQREFGISQEDTTWYEHGYIQRFRNDEKQLSMIHIGFRGPAQMWEPIKILISENTHFRILAFEKNGQKVEVEKLGILDEVVFSDWFHFEQMEHRSWWMRIGDMRVSVFMEGEGKTRVNIERGVYSEINGENQ